LQEFIRGYERKKGLFKSRHPHQVTRAGSLENRPPVFCFWFDFLPVSKKQPFPMLKLRGRLLSLCDVAQPLALPSEGCAASARGKPFDIPPVSQSNLPTFCRGMSVYDGLCQILSNDFACILFCEG